MPAISTSTAAGVFTTSAAIHTRAAPPLLPPSRTLLSFKSRRISCEAAATTEASPSSSASAMTSALSPEEEHGLAKVGVKVRVIVPLKVYHVPKVPELDLNGLVGQIKQYVPVWKGNRISANLPFKVEFVLANGVEGRPGPLKFSAHLREDEFEIVSSD